MAVLCVSRRIRLEAIPSPRLKKSTDCFLASEAATERERSFWGFSLIHNHSPGCALVHAGPRGEQRKRYSYLVLSRLPQGRVPEPSAAEISAISAKFSVSELRFLEMFRPRCSHPRIV